MRKEVILIMKAIRILGRNIRDGFKSVGRNLSLSIASISCITITLLIVGIALIASYNVENMTKLVKEDFTIVTFIDTSATNEQIEDLKKNIESYKNVESVEHQTKTQIADEMKDTSESLSAIIDSWSDDTNPLYDTLLVKVKDTEKISKTVDDTVQKESSKIIASTNETASVSDQVTNAVKQHIDNLEKNVSDETQKISEKQLPNIGNKIEQQAEKSVGEMDKSLTNSMKSQEAEIQKNANELNNTLKENGNPVEVSTKEMDKMEAAANGDVGNLKSANIGDKISGPSSVTTQTVQEQGKTQTLVMGKDQLADQQKKMQEAGSLTEPAKNEVEIKQQLQLKATKADLESIYANESRANFFKNVINALTISEKDHKENSELLNEIIKLIKKYYGSLNLNIDKLTQISNKQQQQQTNQMVIIQNNNKSNPAELEDA